MAIYLPKADAVIYHTHKTGGSWVQEAINAAGIENEQWGYKHAQVVSLLVDSERPLPPNGIAFIRHPITWLQSVWRYRNGAPGQFYGRPMGAINDIAIESNEDFETFVRLYLDHIPGWITDMFMSYIEYAGSTWVSYIGKQENLSRDLIYGLHLCGLKLTDDQLDAILLHPPVNVSKPEVPFMSKNLQARVCATEWKIMRLGGYSV